MKKKNLLKTATTLFLSAALLFTTAVPNFANSPVYYCSDKPWNNTGTVEIYVDNITPEDFLQLQINETPLLTTDYSLVKQGDGVRVIINETVLKNNSETGRNNIWTKVKGDYDTPVSYGGFILEDGQYEFSLEKEPLVKKIVKLKNQIDYDKEYDIDSKYYTITETDDYFVFNFDKDYVDSLEKKVFSVYQVQDYIIFLSYIKGAPGDVNCDEKINLSDAKDTLRAALGIIDTSEEIQQLGDMDGDCKISLSDACLVLNLALGISS